MNIAIEPTNVTVQQAYFSIFVWLFVVFQPWFFVWPWYLVVAAFGGLLAAVAGIYGILSLLLDDRKYSDLEDPKGRATPSDPPRIPGTSLQSADPAEQVKSTSTYMST